MLEIPVKSEWVKMAHERSVDMGVLYNSITHGDGNMAGFIGEMAVQATIGGELVDTHDYDLMVDEQRVEVKTKRTKYKPKPKYSASVSDYNPNQDCDFYFFVRVTNRLDKAYILGYLPKADFYANATFHEKGSWDYSNGFKFTADCYNIPHKELKGWGANTPQQLQVTWSEEL